MGITIDQALQKAVAAHKDGKFQEADRLYTAILTSQPEHPDANHNMGILAVGVGKAERALPFFKNALKVNPKIEQFWYSYIDTLIQLNRFDEVKRALEEAKKVQLEEALRKHFNDRLPKQNYKLSKTLKKSGTIKILNQ